MLVSKFADCDAEATETQVWLDFARDCGCLSADDHQRLSEGYGMMKNPERFIPR
jgi:hypothetical protein